MPFSHFREKRRAAGRDPGGARPAGWAVGPQHPDAGTWRGEHCHCPAGHGGARVPAQGRAPGSATIITSRCSATAVAGSTGSRPSPCARPSRRAGRFDTTLLIDPPDRAGLARILRHQLDTSADPALDNAIALATHLVLSIETEWRMGDGGLIWLPGMPLACKACPGCATNSTTSSPLPIASPRHHRHPSRHRRGPCRSAHGRARDEGGSVEGVDCHDPPEVAPAPAEPRAGT